MALSKIGGNQIDSAASLTVSGNLSADGGTIKLDGNYPTGTNNVALGDAALGGGSLSGGSNVAIGTSALDANTSGTTNIAIGVNALGANTTASDNVAVGHSALKVNTTGTYNTAVGYEALDANTTANNNTAVGYGTLTSNTTGSGNNAFGYSALFSNTTGSNNTTVGANALDNNTEGSNNTAVGHQSLGANTTGTSNVAVGYRAGDSITTGTKKPVMGNDVANNLTEGSYNAFYGSDAGAAVTTGSKNTIIGSYNGNQDGLDIRTLSNYVVLSDGDGNRRITVRNDGKMAIKDAGFAASGFAQVNIPAAGIAIINADTNGHYRANYQSSDQNHYWTNGSNQAYLSSSGAWTDASDVAYKKDITDATYGITTVKAMQPRFYYMNDDAIEDDSRQLGFIAQELEAVVPEVVSGDDGSKGVEYGHLTAVLTKALQEAVAKIETLEARVAALEAG